LGHQPGHSGVDLTAAILPDLDLELCDLPLCEPGRTDRGAMDVCGLLVALFVVLGLAVSGQTATGQRQVPYTLHDGAGIAVAAGG
jgi:hypothetical protein